MTIWNLGSINVDHVYTVSAFVQPGETLTAQSYRQGLGGKGLNQSLAIHRSGGRVRHLGAVGSDDGRTSAQVQAYGLDAPWPVQAPTGHAMIQVNAAGENCIVLAPGANRALDARAIRTALDAAAPGDWLLLQNETSGGAVAVAAAKTRGLKVCYAAAPFEAAAVTALIDQIDLLSVNAVELAQLQASMEIGVAKLVTLGAAGAYYAPLKGPRTSVEAFAVTPVDTTGAGDTFLGAFLAKIDGGLDVAAALRWASGAAALQVTRPGAADAIPTAAEIEVFLREHAHDTP